MCGSWEGRAIDAAACIIVSRNFHPKTLAMVDSVMGLAPLFGFFDKTCRNVDPLLPETDQAAETRAESSPKAGPVQMIGDQTKDGDVGK